MKQYVKKWSYTLKIGTLKSYIEDLIEDGYTILSITPIEYDMEYASKTKFEVISAIILISPINDNKELKDYEKQKTNTRNI